MNSLGRVIGAEFDGALAASLFDVAIEALELESTGPTAKSSTSCR
jgi:hypothetical protein